jgi:hypothetical protein
VLVKRELTDATDAWIEYACQVLAIASSDERASSIWYLASLVGSTHRRRIAQGRMDIEAVIEWMTLADTILHRMRDIGWPSVAELTDEAPKLLRRLRISAKAQARRRAPSMPVRLTGYGLASYA